MTVPIKKLPWIRWVLLAGIALTLYQVLAGSNGLLKILKLRQENRREQARIDSLNARQQELVLEKRRLLTDSAYLEKLARKDLGMAKPGEKVYRFIPAPPDANKSRP